MDGPLGSSARGTPAARAATTFRPIWLLFVDRSEFRDSPSNRTRWPIEGTRCALEHIAGLTKLEDKPYPRPHYRAFDG